MRYERVFVVFVVALTTDAWSSRRPPRPDRTTRGVPTRTDWQHEAARALCGAFLTLGLVFGNPTVELPVLNVQTVASARVAAPLTDAPGLREFLVKDGNELLRLNLPTSLPTTTDPAKLGDTGREAQEAVESVRLRLEQVGLFSGKTPVWNAAFREVSRAKWLLRRGGSMLKDIENEVKLSKARYLVTVLLSKLGELQEAVKQRDMQRTLSLQEECSSLVYEIRLLSMEPGEVPFEIPSEYDGLPRLFGRALVECTLEKTSNGNVFRLPDGSTSKSISFTLTVDGYHAPLTAGNFVDLVERKFYDGMLIQSVDDLIVQTGNPQAQESKTEQTTDAQQQVDGFIDPATLKKRVIPLELFYKSDMQPTYGSTSDYDDTMLSMANPFQAYGALGMVHDPENVNSASSQFFFLKWDPALVPPSRNAWDGHQACFGYITENQEYIGQVQPGDKITSIKVVQGGENLITNRNRIPSSNNVEEESGTLLSTNATCFRTAVHRAGSHVGSLDSLTGAFTEG